MTPQPPSDTDVLIEEARGRLSTWLDDIQLSNQLGCPHYANPSELKRDLRVLLDALAREDEEMIEPKLSVLRELYDELDRLLRWLRWLPPLALLIGVVSLAVAILVMIR